MTEQAEHGQSFNRSLAASSSAKYRQHGSALLLLVGILFVSLSSLMVAFSSIHQKKTKVTLKDWNKTVANEAARSAFSLMEAALQRRMWEMPPDANCLKTTNLSLSGTTPEGASYSVQAEYDPKTSILNMSSKAEYRQSKASFEKLSKIWDASKFLVFSKNTDVTEFLRAGDPKLPIGMIAKDRKIYLEGPVLFGGWINRWPIGGPFPASWGGVVPMYFPGELGTIFQGERISFLGGMRYKTVEWVPGIRSTESIHPLLSPYDGSNRRPQRGGSAAVFTSDHALATNLLAAVKAGDASGIPGIGVLMKQIYPISLFCGTLPLNPESGVDDGCFMNDPRRWRVWSYQYDPSGFYFLGDFTCLEDGDVPEESRKNCSKSTHFPIGYTAWLEEARLKNVLFGPEGTKLNFPKIDWDNFDALKEDATACGALLDDTTVLPRYEDCDLTDYNGLWRYVWGTGHPCGNVMQIGSQDLGALLANFDAAPYQNNANAGLFLRRVIYAKSTVELAQLQPQGLFTSLDNPTARSNLSLWLVGEDQTVLRPYQEDEVEGPLKVDAGRIRKVHFNEDAMGGATHPPIDLVLLSPESVHVITPQRVPYTYAQMQDALPVVGGKIVPKNHILTDELHQENDGFKYGLREVRLNNIALISNTKIPHGNGFYLRGLWGGLDESGSRHLRNACMLDRPGDADAVHADPPATLPIPAYAGSVIPQPSSRFYDKDTYVPRSSVLANEITKSGVPAILHRQSFVSNLGMQSWVYHKGVRINVHFDSTVPAGRRNLGEPSRDPYDDFNGDLSQRRFIWTNNFWFERMDSPGGACIGDNVTYLGTTDKHPWAVESIYLNFNNSQYVQNAPDAGFQNVGAVFAVDMPLVEAPL